jgi:hypothetical protein
MNADVLFVADHFIMVTTIETDDTTDQHDIENAAWDRLGAEYSPEWADTTRKFINKVMVEVVPEPTINDVMKSLAEDEPTDERTTS